MPNSILVAYATNYGSTREVAEEIAERIRAQGADATVGEVRGIKSLAGYDLVVLGAPLYMFRWHRHAKAFLKRLKKQLSAVPVAVFALGPWHDDEKEFSDARGQLDKELARFPWFKPVAVELFGGKFDPGSLRFPYRLIPALKMEPAGDVRDWDAIGSWAESLPGR